MASFDRALAISPDFVDAHVQRSAVLAGLKRYDTAIAACDRALALKPHEIAALLIKAGALQALRRSEAALAAADTALSIAHDNAEALVLRGVALGTLGRLDKSLVSLDRALAIKPDDVDVLINRGQTLNGLGDYGNAVRSLDRALAGAPRNIAALVNCGVANSELQNSREALELFERAVAIDPDHADAQYNRGLVLVQFGRHAEAIASFERALAHAGNRSRVLGELAKALRIVCDWPKLETIAGELLGQIGKGPIDPFLLLGMECTPQQQRAGAERWLADVVGAGRSAFPSPPLRGSGKIKIAYLSADFRSHPTSYLLADLIERHDRGRFDVTGISFGVDDGSALRRRMAQAFDRFHDVTASGDLGIAKLLHDHGTHIAVDLMGYTQYARPGIFAYRPAPIQVSYLGYPGTTAATFMDYILADKIVLPMTEQPCFSERIVHLPDCYQVNDGSRPIAARRNRACRRVCRTKASYFAVSTAA